MFVQGKGNNGNLAPRASGQTPAKPEQSKYTARKIFVDEIKKDRLPRHIAIIMDGNGRWAKKRGLPRTEGHRAGAKAVKTIVSECRGLGIEYLTLYAFSSENWNRPKLEIAALFKLLLEFLNSETAELLEKGVRLNVLGDLEGLPAAQRSALKKSMALTSRCDGMTLNLALNYGSRAEIVQAAKKIATLGLKADEINETSFKKYLYTADIPDPDLLIRASGEERLSNFLLYQCAYSELYFTTTLWPDFDANELAKALRAYSGRERRFGKTGEQINEGEGDGS